VKKTISNFVHPYIPNSDPEIRARMLEEIGVRDVDELYADIPDHLRFTGKLNLPEPLISEAEVKKHVEDILSKNQTCADHVGFLGGGCSRHYVPAICDEINRRAEFLTAYAGEPYEDHGRFQALFEYQSLMGELLDLDVVNVPTYDWSQAASTAMRMAGRITDRRDILVSQWISPDRFAVIRNYCHPVLNIRAVRHDPDTGQLDMDDLDRKLTSETAGLYLENPAYLGLIESNGPEIAERLHREDALFLVGTDPVSLGVMAPPVNYGADIVCGDIQGLGMHLSYGGGLAGFIATRDDPRFVMEYPSRLFGITRTRIEGEYGFGDVAYHRTSFDGREKGKEFVGTHAALWGLTAAVYLALLGPKGMQEMGQVLMQRSKYLRVRLNDLPGVKAPCYRSAHFKEFVADFSRTGKTVAEINEGLRVQGYFGGHDLGQELREWEGTALYCVTEMHTQSELDGLVEALTDVLGKGKGR